MADRNQPLGGLTERRLQSRDTLRRGARIALPVFFSTLLTYGMNLINYIYLAAFQDYRSIAAYGIVAAYTTLAAGIFMPLAAATGAVLERETNSADPYRKQDIINTTMLLAVLVGVLSTIFAVLIAPGYIWQVLTPAEIKEMTTTFLRLFSVNFIPIIYFGVTTTILIQQGNPVAPILAEISALALHAGFGYIFVGMFDMGIYGCAASAILSQTVAALVNTHLILQLRRATPARSPVRINKEIVREVYQEQKPALFVALLGGVFMIFLQYYIDDLGLETIAGFTLFFLFQDFLFLPFRGMSSSVRSLSAEHINDDDTLGLIRTFNPQIIVAILYAIALIPVTKLIGPPIFMVFSHFNADVTVVAMKLVDLVSSYYFFYAISTLLSASLEGLGRKQAAMRFNVGFNYVVRFLVLVLAAEVIQGGESIAFCYPASWAISAGALAIYYYINYSKGNSIKYSI